MQEIITQNIFAMQTSYSKEKTRKPRRENEYGDHNFRKFEKERQKYRDERRKQKRENFGNQG